MDVKLYQKNGSDRVQSFIDREWLRADNEHFKRRVHWNLKQLTLVAYGKRRIVGAVQFNISAGVAYVETLVVAEKHRQKGIGKMLMASLESVAKTNGAHKIYLETGKTWGARKFYKDLGFKVTGELPNHYFHVNFLLFSKAL